jgi:hypothetical protein
MLGGGVAIAGKPDSAPSGITEMLDVDFFPDVASRAGRPRGARLDYHFLAGNPQTGERLPAIRGPRRCGRERRYSSSVIPDGIVVSM